MNFEWNITLTLSAIAILSISLTIRFVWHKVFSPKIKVKNGDSSFAQTGPVNGPGSVGIATNGDGNHYHIDTGTKTIITHPPQPKYGETRKRAAKKEIRKAFGSYFYSFLGKEGMEGHIGGIFAKQNLDPTRLKAFKAHYAPRVPEIVYGCKNRLEIALVTHAQFLEDPSAEQKIDELRQRLVNVADSDVFEITEDLRAVARNEIDAILGTEKDEPK